MAMLDNVVETIHDQPIHIKIGGLALIVVIIAAAYWYFYWSPGADDLKRARIKLNQSQKKLAELKAVQAELPKFELENKRLNKEFQLISAKLPKDKEIPGLIDNVHSEISASNLDSIIFAPKGQINKEIYAEIPIQMEVVGAYYSLADFFDRISKLPRIVNVRNLVLKRKGIQGGNVILDASFNVVTFRLLPQQNINANQKGKKGRKGKKR